VPNIVVRRGVSNLGKAIPALTGIHQNPSISRYTLQLDEDHDFQPDMKKSLIRSLALVSVLALAVLPRPALGADQPTPQITKIRVLVITGGHDFEREPFFKMFQDNAHITFQAVEHPKAHEYLRPEASAKYDVVVLYDLWPKISEEAKADFINLLNAGKGLVALHHCLASYQDWPEYEKIIGGKYFLEKHQENGVEKPGSTYQHGVKFNVHVADPKHAVTRGLSDFDVVDETYGLFKVLPGVKPLLTTTETTSGKTIGWVHSYGKARVAYIELGHDHVTYENPNYRRLLDQAIQWTGHHRFIQ
jgi:type 1 glutamine amidotransferase